MNGSTRCLLLISTLGLASCGGSALPLPAAGSGGRATCMTPAGGQPAGSLCSPPEPWPCDAGSFTFVHDPATGTCKFFGPSQCNGGNVFPTLAACERECGAKPDLDVCDVPSDCQVADAGCCPACEPVGASTLTAINVRRSQEHGARCGDVDCAACPGVDELSSTRQYFVPTCEVNKRCALIDIREHNVTECQTDADCRLRDGSACCGGCDGQGLVSVSSDALFTAQCGPDTACPECEPIFSEHLPSCAGSRCTVVRSFPPPPP